MRWMVFVMLLGLPGVVLAGPDASAASLWPNVLAVGGSINVSGVQSDDSGEPPASFSHLWDFGDGSVATSYSAAHVYTAVGVHSVTYTVTNTVTGLSDQTGWSVEVGMVTSKAVFVLVWWVVFMGGLALGVWLWIYAADLISQRVSRF